jgi:hypothetical protein
MMRIRHTVVVLLVTMPQGLASCDVTSLITTLAEHDCRTNADPRISAERSAILFLTTHVYYPLATLDRAPYRVFANDAIPPILDNVNTYLDEVGFNIVLSRQESLVESRLFMAPVVLNEGGFPLPESETPLKNAARADMSNLHVHWSPTSTQNNVAGYGGGRVELLGEPPLMWLGLIENPLGSPKSADQRSRNFAHELGHVFDLPHVFNDPTNLMYSGSLGREVTAAQIQMFWDSFNRQHSNFEVISCLKDPEVTALVNDHTAEEIREALNEASE